MRRLALLFSGKRGGGITDLTNILNGFLKINNSHVNLSIITLRRFNHLEKTCYENNISYYYISKNCDTLPKEVYANIKFIFYVIKNIFRNTDLLFTMTHPNLLVFPLYRFLSYFTKSKLSYIRHNPTGFRHVANQFKNDLTVVADFIASKFSHRLFFFSKNVLTSFYNTSYHHKSYYIGFGINSFSSKKYKLTKTGNKNFIFFGRCLPYKGLDILIESLRLIKSKRINFVIASNSIPKSLIGKLEVLKKNHNIIIYNEWLEDEKLDYLFKDASCAVLPYREISQSGPILTSIGYKIPIISSDLNGVKEYLTDAHDSLLFRCGDANSLKEKLLLFMESTEIQKKLNNGISHTADKFSWKNVSIKIEEIITNA